MKRYFCVFTLVLLGASASCYAQSQLLPERFSSWQPGQHAPIVLWPRNSATKLNPQLESEQMLAESGVVRIEERYYQKENRELAVRLWKMRDSSGAYEIYTNQLKPDMLPARLGQVSAFSEEGVVILVGNVVLSSTANASRDDLNALLQAVEASSKVPLPPIPTYLPDRGRVLGTERYALGPVAFRMAARVLDRADYAALVDEIGFKSGAEAMFARYLSGKDDAVLLLIEYPTPQLAEQHLHHLEQALSSSAKQAGTTIERKASLLSLALKPSSAAYGESLRSAVNYETQVTWNEPTHTISDPPWATVLGKIFIFTGLFMVVALVLGVAFGGVRVLTKIFFPGKVFDRADQMDVLQLGLSGKRIDSRDFY